MAATPERTDNSVPFVSVLSFTVDPANSSMTLSGGAFCCTGDPLNFEPQDADSMTTFFAGTILVDPTADSIEFVGGQVDAQETGADYLPCNPPAPADYAFQADSGSDLVGSMVGAVRDAKFTMTSDPLPLVAGRAFDIFEIDSSTSTFDLVATAGLLVLTVSPPAACWARWPVCPYRFRDCRRRRSHRPACRYHLRPSAI